MALQTWWTAASAIPFPTVIRGLGLTVSMVQLRKLYWHTPANKLVGVFCNTLTDFDLGGGILLSWRVQYLWRDGQPVDTSVVLAELNSNELPITHTTDGRVVRQGNQGATVADTEIARAVGDGLFQIATQWANDIIAYPALGQTYQVTPNIQASVLRVGIGDPSGDSSYGYRVSSLNGWLIVVREPEGATLLSAFNPSLFGVPRDFLWIDNQTAAITTIDTGGPPALIHVVSAAGEEWSLKWSAELPAADTVAAYDPSTKILYSCGRYEDNAILHASWLRRAPASLSVLTLVTGTTLVELDSSVVSVLVTDSLECGICNYDVCWTLNTVASGGRLISAYSKTNNSGIAQITYVGPLLDTTTITETICAAVTTIEPVTHIR